MFSWTYQGSVFEDSDFVNVAAVAFHLSARRLKKNFKSICSTPGQNLIDVYSHFNQKCKRAGLGQPGIESDYF